MSIASTVSSTVGSTVGSSVGVGGGALVFDIYVDSVNGDDGNTGASPAQALQTLAAAESALSAGDSLGLVKGSHWRESLDLSALSGVTLGVAGSGDPPLIDGSDVVASWTAEGTANVWQASVGHDATNTNRGTVYEDGILLTRVADAATCSSTPGSFVDIKGSDGTPWTVKIHATDSGDPNSNGSVYEVSTRTIVLSGGVDFTATGPIQTRRAINNNGSFDAVGRSGSAVSRVVAANGTKHNLGSGSGYVRDCVTVFADPPTSYEASNTAYVAYLVDPSAASAEFTRCFSVQGSVTGGTAFYAHGSPNPFGEILLDQCGTYGSLFFSNIATGQATNLVIRNGIALPTKGDLLRGCFQLVASGTSSGIGTLEDVALYSASRTPTSNFTEVFRPDTAVVATQCAFTMEYNTGDRTNLFANGSASDVTLNLCVFFCGNRHIDKKAGSTYVGDFNVFFADNNFNGSSRVINYYEGVQHLSLSAWQTASGQDANSVYLAEADQVAGGANAFWLGHVEAAGGTDINTVGPGAGDFRINPSARVYGGDDTPYIGTFADGTTPITDAGPQTHWDWNARAVVATTPLAWPTIPANIEQAEAYIADPEAWDFYP